MLDRILALDIETTGLDAKTERIIQIGAVRIEKGVITETYQSLVNPGRKISERIVELTGITDEQVENAPALAEVLPEFLAFAGEDVLLGHHVIFDYSFLKRAAVNEKRVFERKGLDTLKIARRFLPELESRSLPFLCKHFSIEHQAHNAMGDALATWKLYEKLCRDYPVDEIFQPEQLIYKVKRETPITPRQKERLLQILTHYKLELDIEIESLTRNEASRITDRILAQYGRFSPLQER